MKKVTLQTTTISESLDDIQRIMAKLDAATIGQLKGAVMGLCENIVQLTAICPDNDSFMIAALSILETALDQNKNEVNEMCRALVGDEPLME